MSSSARLVSPARNLSNEIIHRWQSRDRLVERAYPHIVRLRRNRTSDAEDLMDVPDGSFSVLQGNPISRPLVSLPRSVAQWSQLSPSNSLPDSSAANRSQPFRPIIPLAAQFGGRLVAPAMGSDSPLSRYWTSSTFHPQIGQLMPATVGRETGITPSNRFLSHGRVSSDVPPTTLPGIMRSSSPVSSSPAKDISPSAAFRSTALQSPFSVGSTPSLSRFAGISGAAVVSPVQSRSKAPFSVPSFAVPEQVLRYQASDSNEPAVSRRLTTGDTIVTISATDTIHTHSPVTEPRPLREPIARLAVRDARRGNLAENRTASPYQTETIVSPFSAGLRRAVDLDRSGAIGLFETGMPIRESSTRAPMPLLSRTTEVRSTPSFSPRASFAVPISETASRDVPFDLPAPGRPAIPPVLWQQAAPSPPDTVERRLFSPVDMNPLNASSDSAQSPLSGVMSVPVLRRASSFAPILRRQNPFDVLPSGSVPRSSGISSGETPRGEGTAGQPRHFVSPVSALFRTMQERVAQFRPLPAAMSLMLAPPAPVSTLRTIAPVANVFATLHRATDRLYPVTPASSKDSSAPNWLHRATTYRSYLTIQSPESARSGSNITLSPVHSGSMAPFSENILPRFAEAVPAIRVISPSPFVSNLQSVGTNSSLGTPQVYRSSAVNRDSVPDSLENSTLSSRGLIFSRVALSPFHPDGAGSRTSSLTVSEAALSSTAYHLQRMSLTPLASAILTTHSAKPFLGRTDEIISSTGISNSPFVPRTLAIQTLNLSGMDQVNRSQSPSTALTISPEVARFADIAPVSATQDNVSPATHSSVYGTVPQSISRAHLTPASGEVPPHLSGISVNRFVGSSFRPPMGRSQDAGGFMARREIPVGVGNALSDSVGENPEDIPLSNLLNRGMFLNRQGDVTTRKLGYETERNRPLYRIPVVQGVLRETEGDTEVLTSFAPVRAATEETRQTMRAGTLSAASLVQRQIDTSATILRIPGSEGTSDTATTGNSGAAKSGEIGDGSLVAVEHQIDLLWDRFMQRLRIERERAGFR